MTDANQQSLSLPIQSAIAADLANQSTDSRISKQNTGSESIEGSADQSRAADVSNTKHFNMTELGVRDATMPSIYKDTVEGVMAEIIDHIGKIREKLEREGDKMTQPQKNAMGLKMRRAYEELVKLEEIIKNNKK